MTRRLFAFAKVALASLVGVAFLFVVSGAAGATAVVSPTSAAAGATVDLVFRITSTDPQSPTTKVQIDFPTGSGVTVADTQLVRGWSPTINRAGNEVGSVVWSSGTLAPNASQDFVVTVSLPTTTDSMSFVVTQTYEDGTFGRFTDTTPTNDTSTSTPSTLTVAITGATTTTTTAAPAVPTTVAPSSGKSGRSKAGEIFIVVGVLAVLFAYLRTRALARGATRKQRRRR